MGFNLEFNGLIFVEINILLPTIPLLPVFNLYRSFYCVLLHNSIYSVIFYSCKRFWDPKFVHCYLMYL